MNIEFRSLGTDISVQIIGKNISPDIETGIRYFYKKKEEIFSRFDPESELVFLNKHAGRYNSASSDIIELAGRCLDYYKKTDGYFDPRIIKILENIGYNKDFKSLSSGPLSNLDVGLINHNLEDDLKIDGEKVYFGCRMDFSGIAKGYIIDKAADFLKKKGYKNFLIDSGGDIITSGKDENGENWKISVEGVHEEKILLELNEKYPAVATSGITRRKWERGEKRFHHLINPKNPQEYKFDLKTVTVIGRTCEEVDVWAKVLFLMGKKKGLEFSNQNDVKCIFLDYRCNVYLSKNIKNNIISSF